MAIKTTHHCDQCQTEILPDPTRPGFPQLSWCFFRKGSQVGRKPSGEPVLQQSWQGKVNRMEFCADHGQELNVLLKAFAAKDPALMGLIQVLQKADDSDRAGKEETNQQLYKDALAKFSTQGKAS